MNNLLDDQHLDDDLRGSRDREITLGTTWVLLIFFGLAVLCAAFFGFGYSLGSKRTSAASAPASAGSVSGTTSPGSKPAPGSPLGRSPAESQSPLDSTQAPSPTTRGATRTVLIPEAGHRADPDLETPRPSVAARPSPPAPAPPIAAAIPSGPLPVVQVTAVSHQEDADLVASTLKRRGYDVVIRQEAQDKLFHVQVGPFNTRKEADSMRQRLLADGFNAYVK